MIRNEVIESAYIIPGQTWPVEMGFLFDLFRLSKRHVEVGSFCGQSLWITAGAMHDGKAAERYRQLIAVDPLNVHIPDYREPSPGWTRACLGLTIQAIGRVFPSVQVEHWPLLSIDGFNKAAAEKQELFDSVYIDADHNYAECKADIEMWRTLVRPNGYICGHDFWAKDAGVMDAVSESFGPDFQVCKNGRVWCHQVK